MSPSGDGQSLLETTSKRLRDYWLAGWRVSSSKAAIDKEDLVHCAEWDHIQRQS